MDHPLTGMKRENKEKERGIKWGRGGGEVLSEIACGSK